MEDTNFEVFKMVSEIVQEDDFTNAQHAYFEKNKESFEDTEENKLEYTQIFEQYVTILEEIIAARLKEKYSEEQIEAFYLSFQDNLKKYEQENAISVETVFGLIDFDKFKSSILRYKKDSASLASEETATVATTLGGQDDSVFYAYDKEDPNDPASGWVEKAKSSKKDDMMQYVMHSKKGDGKINIMRNAIVMKGIKKATFDEFAANFDKQMDDKEMKHIKEFRVVEKLPDGTPALMYSRSKMPMMTERENLVAIVKSELDDGRTLSVARSVDRPEFPRTKAAIRMDMFKASVFYEKDGDLHLTEYSNFDLGGYFP